MLVVKRLNAIELHSELVSQKLDLPMHRAHVTTRGEQSKHVPFVLLNPGSVPDFQVSLNRHSTQQLQATLLPSPPLLFYLFCELLFFFPTAIYGVLSSSRFPGVKSYYCREWLLGCVSAVCRERYPPATLITHAYLENTNSERWCYIHRERLRRSRVRSWAHSGQDVLV